MRKLYGILISLLLISHAYGTTAVLRPDANSSTAFTGNGACSSTGNWECVNDATPDDDSGYNTSTVDGAIDMFNITDGSIDSGDTIDSVILTCRAKDTGGGNNKIILRVTHDSSYDGSSTALLTGYADLTHDVTSSESWEPADFDGTGLTIGYESDGNGGAERRVTQCFLTVEHTAGGGDRRVIVID